MARIAGWRAQPQTVARTVWGPHPVQIARWLERVFAIDVEGSPLDVMRRGEDNSATNGTRFMGDLGPLQSFGRIYGLRMSMARVGASNGRLPTAQGGAASPNSALVDLLGRTVG